MRLTIADIAMLEQVTPRQAQRYCRDGLNGHVLKAVRVGHSLLIEKQDYFAWRQECGLDKVETDPVPVPTVAAAPETHTETKPAPKEPCEEEPRRSAPEPLYRPANPCGPITNVPHPSSSNWPAPAVMKQRAEQAARDLVATFRGNPDENEKRLNTQSTPVLPR